MYTVHGLAMSGNCYKVKLALSQLDKPFQWNEVDMKNGAHRTPAFLAMNPNGKVPVLQIGASTYLPESNAILYYLAQGSSLFPEDRWEQAQVMQWLFFLSSTATSRNWLWPALLFTLPTAPPRAKTSCKAALPAAQGAGSDGTAFAGQALFFVGDKYSIADIALYAYTIARTKAWWI